MGSSATTTSIRQLPQVLAATLAVVGVPVAMVSALRAAGALPSVLPLVAAGTGLSLVISYAGSALWSARASEGGTVFGDLMLWGWLRRRRQERQIASASALLGLRGDPEGRRPAQLSLGRRTRVLERLAAALEARDPVTHGHSRRVARHATAVAKRMGLPSEQVARIRTAATIHDVGKVKTPVEIVSKPGALTEEEFAVIKRHSVDGARMVAALGDDELTRIVLHHHERLDGRGYPSGLAGEEIPVGARVIAVADTFDAITSMRPYRSARRHREALALLAKEAGTQLDPDAVRAFRGYYSGLRPVALCSFLLNLPRQLATSLGEQLRLGSVTVATKSTAVTLAAVTAGTVATGSLQLPSADAQDQTASLGKVVATEPVAALSGTAPENVGSDGTNATPAGRSAPDKGGRMSVLAAPVASDSQSATGEAQPGSVNRDSSDSGQGAAGGTNSGSTDFSDGGNRSPAPSPSLTQDKVGSTSIVDKSPRPAVTTTATTTSTAEIGSGADGSTTDGTSNSADSTLDSDSAKSSTDLRLSGSGG